MKLPYIGETSRVFENKIKDLRKTTYSQVSPRIIFLSKFNCFCERSYIGQTSRHFKTSIKEHLPACVLKLIEKEPEIKTTATKNAAKRSSVAEHLINSRDCAR